MNLKDAVPFDLIIPMFKDVKTEVLATDLEGLKKNRPQDIGAICMFVWDEMVDRGATKTPYKIGPIVNNGFKGIYKFVREELKKHPVVDAYAVSLYNEIQPDVSFVDVSLVQCYPNDIHIADIEFSDNRMPVAGAKGGKLSQRPYHGLHVFGEFLDRLKAVAKDRDVERISLMVAHPDLYEVFRRHGFAVSTTMMAQAAFKGPRVGFPMILKI